VKKIFWRTLSVLLLLTAFSGCELTSADEFDDEDQETRFENNASVAVTVIPAAEEEFDTFTLQPNERTTVQRVGAQATFTFSPSTVQVQEISNEEVVFTE
jgi:hypothetical protein